MIAHRSTPMLMLLALLGLTYRWPVQAQNVAAWVIAVMVIGGVLFALSLVVRWVSDWAECRVFHKGDPEYDAFEKARLDLLSRSGADLTDAEREALRTRLDLGPVRFNVKRGVFIA